MGLTFVVVFLAVLLGAVLQGCLGFGMVVLAFPVLVTASPDLLPGPMVIASLPVVTINLWRNWAGVDWREFFWLMSGRLPGTAMGLVLLSVINSTALTIVGGLTVLGAVIVSAWAPPVPRRPATMLAGGISSGILGTSVGIGGPPIALLYHHDSGAKLRSTVSTMLFAGTPITAISLAASQSLDGTDLRTGLALMPATTLGILLAPRFIPWMDQRLRQAVLIVSGFAAVVAVGHVVLNEFI